MRKIKLFYVWDVHNARPLSAPIRLRQALALAVGTDYSVVPACS